MKYGATTQEKRAKPHKRRTKILFAITLVAIVCMSILIREGSKYESKAAKGDEIPTFDSRAAGITMNLFDYYGEYDNGKKNLDYVHYINWGVASEDSNTVKYPKYFGINTKRVGTNDVPRDVKKDLLFLAGAADSSEQDRALNIFTGGNTARQGLVENKLEGGYPKLKVGGQSSLRYLFDPDEANAGKNTYKDVNHLFKMSKDGYFEYDSNNQYAYYDVNPANNGARNFKVYEFPGSPGFFPFNTYEFSKNNSNVDPGAGYNHHFGMTMNFEFMMNQNGTIDASSGGTPLVFEFRGDDDVWVFIDDVLVLDIGGIHEAVDGSINFKSGDVTVTGSAGKKLDKLFQNAYQDESVTLSNNPVFNNNANGMHTLKFFYLERGSKYSNNRIKCNLPIGLRITKAVAPTHEGTTTKIDMSNDYKFQLYVKNGSKYDLYGGSNKKAYINNEQLKFSTNSLGEYYFTMKAGQTVDIYDLHPWQEYYLKEIDINQQQIMDVKIGDTALHKYELNGIFYVETSVQKVKDRTNICFTNYPKEYMGLKVIKSWFKPDGKTTKTDVPDSITIQLKRGIKNSSGSITSGESVGQEVNIVGPAKGGNWTYVWDNDKLEAFNSDNVPYYYYVEEVKVGDKLLDDLGYTVEYPNNNVFYGSKDKDIKIKNTCKFIDNITLPETGGMGTTIFFVTGIALLLLSCMFYLVAVRKGGVSKS